QPTSTLSSPRKNGSCKSSKNRLRKGTAGKAEFCATTNLSVYRVTNTSPALLAARKVVAGRRQGGCSIIQGLQHKVGGIAEAGTGCICLRNFHGGNCCVARPASDDHCGCGYLS
ncbi:unnamed protein product, partial [Ectocarpus sp. 4 AP-2014]